MNSLIELVEQVNRGDDIPGETLRIFQDSTNAAERFLAHHAGATLGLRQCHRHLLEALRAIDFGDRKVLDQFSGLCAFLGTPGEATGPTIAFANSSIERGELCLGLEAASSAVAGDLSRGGPWSKRRDNAETLAGLYQEAAIQIGWAGGGELNNAVPKVAYVASSLGDDEPAARAAASFAASINPRKLQLCVYSTEGYVSRERRQWNQVINNGDGALPTARRGSAAIGRISDAGASHWIAPTQGQSGGDILSAAKALADKIAEDVIDIVFIDAEPSDPVASLLACWPVAQKTIWIARRSGLMSSNLDGICYLDPAAAERDRAWWLKRGIEPASTIEGVDLTQPHGEGPRRAQYGIPDSAVIAATSCDDIPRHVGQKMIEQVITLLRKNPQVVFLMIGSGETANFRRMFEAAGVGKRVGYAGQRRDLAAFLKMADFYLCPFAAEPPAARDTLVAMSVGLPTLSMIESGGDTGATPPCEFVGPEGTASSGTAWQDLASKMSREANSRRQMGEAMHARVEAEFAFTQTASALCDVVSNELGVDAQAVQTGEMRKAA